MPLTSSISEGLSLQEQIDVLAMLPNYHKWQWGDQPEDVKMEQRFSSSSRYFPGSPRKRIVNAIVVGEERVQMILDTLQQLLGIKRSNTNEKVKLTRKLPPQKRSRPVFSEEAYCRTLGMTKRNLPECCRWSKLIPVFLTSITVKGHYHMENTWARAPSDSVEWNGSQISQFYGNYIILFFINWHLKRSGGVNNIDRATLDKIKQVW